MSSQGPNGAPDGAIRTTLREEGTLKPIFEFPEIFQNQTEIYAWLQTFSHANNHRSNSNISS